MSVHQQRQQDPNWGLQQQIPFAVLCMHLARKLTHPGHCSLEADMAKCCMAPMSSWLIALSPLQATWAAAVHKHH